MLITTGTETAFDTGDSGYTSTSARFRKEIAAPRVCGFTGKMIKDVGFKVKTNILVVPGMDPYMVVVRIWKNNLELF